MSNQKTIKLPVALAIRIKNEYKDMDKRVAMIERAMAMDQGARGSVEEPESPEGTAIEPFHVEAMKPVVMEVTLPSYMASYVSQAAGRVARGDDAVEIWAKVAKTVVSMESRIKRSAKAAAAMEEKP